MMSEINVGERVIDLIEAVAALKKEVHDMGKLVEKVVSIDNRLKQVESVLQENKTIKEHHKRVGGFFLKNWDKILTVFAFFSLAASSWLGVDIALNYPSKSQEKVIERLQSQVSHVQTEVNNKK